MKKLFKGSALVYTLIMMMLLLVGALSLVTTTIIQQRSSGGTNESFQAFQLANDGSEDILAFYKHNPAAKIRGLGDCTDGGGLPAVVSKDILTGKYTATFERIDGTMATTCNASISDISEVKISATVGSSTRAIQTAFADACESGDVCVIASSADKDCDLQDIADLEEKILEGWNNLSMVCSGTIQASGPSTFALYGLSVQTLEGTPEYISGFWIRALDEVTAKCEIGEVKVWSDGLTAQSLSCTKGWKIMGVKP